MGLKRYHAKRDFERTPEPRGRLARSSPKGGAFVVHEHDATRLHYDLRLEMDGVLRSWAVPKGPSLDPQVKRLAVHVEDHPTQYGRFEGVIPEGAYGAGPVILWDRGRWTPQGDAREGYRKGALKFELHGEKLRGGWALVRLKRREGEREAWLLVKERDAEVRRGRAAEITARRRESVKTGRTLADLARPAAPSGRARPTKGARARKRPAVRSAQPAKTTRPHPGQRLDPGSLPGAKRGPLPDRPAVQLATLVESAPDGPGWVHEIKFDGYRLLARVDRGTCRLLTRGGHDWARTFPEIERAVLDLPVTDALLDGEAVIVEPDGTTSFQALQGALSGGDRSRLRFYAFDLLHLDGVDLRGAPLLERKALLERLLGRAPGLLRYSRHVAGRGASFLAAACGHDLEGVVSKLADGTYQGRRTRGWQKSKCDARQELVLAGFTPHTSDPRAIGALLLGVRAQDGTLRYAGRVGTGFSEAQRRDLRRRLEAIPRATSPFADDVPDARRARFAQPRLVAEVRSTEWTADGRLRHPVFLGLRADKPAREVVMEKPVPRATPRAAETTLTHPDRVLWRSPHVTKQDLAAYYEQVAPRMLPHVLDRPLMLARCPEGVGSPCFFQKHMVGRLAPGLRAVSVGEGGRGGKGFVLDGAEGLRSLVQQGALEIHGWMAHAEHIERPDRLVFDLDPAPDVPFAAVVAAARHLRRRLASLGLVSFPSTTGGKGLHLHVPLDGSDGWDAVKGFARAFAEALVAEAPDTFVATASKALRKGHIFVDWLRNGRGATAVVPYSTRARPGAPVATPLAWSEVGPRLLPARFTVLSVPSRVARGRDPWASWGRTRQRLPRKAPASRARRGTPVPAARPRSRPRRTA